MKSTSIKASSTPGSTVQSITGHPFRRYCLAAFLAASLFANPAKAQQEFRIDLENYKLFDSSEALPRDLNKLFQIKMHIIRQIQGGGVNAAEDIQMIKLLVDTQRLIVEEFMIQYPNREKMVPAERDALEKAYPIMKDEYKSFSTALIAGWEKREKDGEAETDNLIEKYKLKRHLYVTFSSESAMDGSEEEMQDDEDEEVKSSDPTPSLISLATMEMQIFEAVRDGKLDDVQNPTIKQWINTFLSGGETTGHHLFADNKKPASASIRELQQRVRNSEYAQTGGLVIPDDETEFRRNQFMDQLKQLVEAEWEQLAPQGRLATDNMDRAIARDFRSAGEFLLNHLISYNHWKQAAPLMKRLADVDEALYPDNPQHEQQRSEWRSVSKITGLMASQPTDSTMCTALLASSALRRLYLSEVSR